MPRLSRRDLLAASGAGLLAPGAGALAQAATPRHGGTLNAAIIPDPPMLVAAFSVSSPAIIVGGKIFEGLCSLGFDFELKPALAESWEEGADGRSWTFRLRRGVTWHDGRPFTSADVAFSIMEVSKKLHSRSIQTLANVTAVETPDAHTAVFRLSAPAPFMRTALVSHETSIVPRHVYEGTDILNNPANARPVGTGPFRFREWRRGSFIILERNPDYWDKPKPYLDRIVFRVIPDASARAAALETGDLHVAGPNPVPLSDLRRLAERPNLEVVTRGHEYFSPMIYLQFNLRHPILGKREVRHAIAHAIDQRFIVRNILFGYGAPGTGLIPPSQGDFRAADLPQYPFDRRRAEALLDAAGHPRGRGGVRFEVTIDPQNIGEHYTRTGEFIRESLNQVGIRTTLRNEDVGAWNRRVFTQNDYEMTLYGAVLLGDPAIGLQRFIDSRNIRPGLAFSNASFYANPRVDELLDASRAETDRARRRAMWHDIQRIAQEDLPIFPVADFHWLSVADRRLRDWISSPYAYYDSFAGAWLAT